MQGSPAAAPTPALIFETFNAYQKTAALKAAIELDIFTGIGEGAATPKTLAERCRASERGVRILCDYLVIAGLLTKNGEGYGLTQDSAVFLDRRSPACMASAVRFLNAPDLINAFQDLAAAVRKGGTAMSPDGTMGPDNAVWVEFARSMVPLMAPAAEEIAGLIGADAGKKCKVLDIAAGHGIFGVTIARRNPNAEIVAVDWAGVLEVAKENAERAGVASRYRTLPDSAFDVDFGAGYDVVLLTNFLHHFDPPTIENLLRKVHRSLNDGGLAVTLEFVPNEYRVSPPIPASFSLIMLGTTPSGDAYTFSEFDKMFRAAGFRHSEIRSLERSPEQVIISRK